MIKQSHQSGLMEFPYFISKAEVFRSRLKDEVCFTTIRLVKSLMLFYCGAVVIVGKRYM